MNTLTATQQQQLYDIAKHNILAQHWKFLHEPWKIVVHDKWHRELPHTIPSITALKDTIHDTFGVLGPFVFLNEFFSCRDWSSPYRNVEKGLVYLYSLISGNSVKKMANWMPSTTFTDLRNEIIRKNYDQLNDFVDVKLQTCFSSPELRMISAQMKNPSDMKSITMYLDGHDSRANYNSWYDINRHITFSYKLLGPGFRMQSMMDVNEFWIGFSNAANCADGNDGTMFIDFLPYRFMSSTDVMQVDGIYKTFLPKLLRKEDCTLTDDNFRYPIRKIKMKNFELGEAYYNEKFGSKRSTIETGFARVQNCVSRFEKYPARHKHSIREFALEFKLVCLLLNFKQAESFFNITLTDTHRAWIKSSFDFPTVEQPPEEAGRAEREYLKNQRMVEVQQQALMSFYQSTFETDDIFPSLLRYSEGGNTVDTTSTVSENISQSSARNTEATNETVDDHAQSITMDASTEAITDVDMTHSVPAIEKNTSVTHNHIEQEKPKKKKQLKKNRPSPVYRPPHVTGIPKRSPSKRKRVKKLIFSPASK